MTTETPAETGQTDDLRAAADRAAALVQRMVSEPASRSAAGLGALLSEIHALQALLPGAAAVEDEDEAFDNMPV